ncbi:uncharacterized protein MONBRDRAFT_27313 [Monosiga brevicollis MX1]|uniref:Cation/H+ exchanger transmembrane domain-containing protein n=1 Tax=Monosiga brevicollis TaxID=81824 RepID=A9V4X8_MONBE|nr:uncharacterized protein MONBRDRAFT_27313 [Monosiga brevicollis MX1]EDQ87531.1 predicted protein [Monosiga brevicollis MX1]|eukprot:XP_001747791.1 hypothetical protein [Monosiga brevicollis MX1]
MAGSSAASAEDHVPAPDNAVFFFTFLLITLASITVGGLLKRKLDFPLLTGFLITGILAGPYVLKMLSKTEVDQLDFVFDICLGFIAFAAGSELYYPEIKDSIQAIVKITTAQTITILVLGTLGVWAFSPMTSFMKDMELSQQIAVALLTAAIFIARSPSSAIAIINELGAKGPFVQTALGVTMKTIFADDEKLQGEFVTILIGEVVVSAIIGYVASALIKLVLRLEDRAVRAHVEKHHPRFFRRWWRPYLEGEVVRLRGILTLAVGFLVFYLAEFLKTEAHIHLETLLTCMVAAAIIVNSDKKRCSDGHVIHFRKRLHHALEAVSEPIYVAFFTLVGLGLNISVIPDVIDVALYFFFLRLLVLAIGSFIGSKWAGDPPLFGKISWLTYLTQAGVALALTEEIKEEFQPWGEDYATTVVSVLVIGQIVGPLTFKWAVQRAGEAHQAGAAAVSGNAANAAARLIHVWWHEEEEDGPSHATSFSRLPTADEPVGLNDDSVPATPLNESTSTLLT